MRLLSDKLVRLIEKNSDAIIDRWIQALLSDPTTTSFTEKKILKTVQEKARTIMGNLGTWVSYDTDKVDVGRVYAKEGITMFRLGIPLCEGIKALILLKRILWLFVMDKSNIESALELNQMRELNDRVVLFFDRAEYYLIRGYMEEMNRKMKKLWNLTDQDTEQIFFKKSFYHQ